MQDILTNNNTAEETITTKDLTSQIRLALSDFFIAELKSVEENIVELTFPADQKFILTLDKRN